MGLGDHRRHASDRRTQHHKAHSHKERICAGQFDQSHAHNGYEQELHCRINQQPHIRKHLLKLHVCHGRTDHDHRAKRHADGHGPSYTYDAQGNLLFIFGDSGMQTGNLTAIKKYVNDVEEIIERETTPLQMQHEYYPNGQIKREASFRGGKREGTWREFDENGNVISSQIYQNGRLVQSGIMDTDGTRRGEGVERYPDSTLRSQGLFINGKRSGEWKFYFPGEKLEQVGRYKDGKLDGTWTWYDESGRIQKQEDFFNDVPEGKYIEYDEHGKVIAEGSYFDGMKSGKWKEQSGDVFSEGEYRNDQQVGEGTSYYANGKIAFKGSFKGGYPDGEHRYYYPNGKLREVQNYSGGIRNGVWKKYLDTGELFLEETYKQDKDEILREE